jgi:CheY-like chemotaxis protein
LSHFFTTKGAGQGTGLGLSQVYGFVKQSGGNVTLESAPNAGTSVKIFLPRLLAEEATDAKQSTVIPTEATSTKGRTILIVEDDEDVREVTAAILRDLGYLVSEAGDAMTALKLVGSGTGFDLILTDIGLPGPLNGRQFADQVRLRLPDQKVLFSTGYERNTIVHDGRLDPGVELITKPFSVMQLATKLREMFGGD